jgi:hypothetical protein
MPEMKDVSMTETDDFMNLKDVRNDLIEESISLKDMNQNNVMIEKKCGFRRMSFKTITGRNDIYIPELCTLIFLDLMARVHMLGHIR